KRLSVHRKCAEATKSNLAVMSAPLSTTPFEDRSVYVLDRRTVTRSQLFVPLTIGPNANAIRRRHIVDKPTSFRGRLTWECDRELQVSSGLSRKRRERILTRSLQAWVTFGGPGTAAGTIEAYRSLEKPARTQNPQTGCSWRKGCWIANTS